jgi:transcriptional regulator with XRE-family HTH domain
MTKKDINSAFKVGSNIKKLRELRNYTQEYMAEALKITQAGYSKIEKDGTDITFKKLVQIAEILEVKLADILEFDEKLVFNFSENQGNSSNGLVINNETQTKELYERLLETKDQQILELKEVIVLLKTQLA